MIATVNINTGADRRNYIGIKNGVHKHGVNFNFCPFCGESLQTWELDSKEV